MQHSVDSFLIRSFVEKKVRKDLEDKLKMPIFAASEQCFGYPGRIPRGQDYIDTTHFKN
jgi:hypothetical protein